VSASNAHRRRLTTLTTLSQRAQTELALQRLGRFAALEREYAGQLNEAGVRLVRASTFSAYCDCRDLGVGKRAEHILAQAGLPAGDLGQRPVVATA
jgi:hypothetical protein